ncbi:MAG: ATP-dependent zinc protease [Gammaproteobacteria bacterium]|nr:ATP-dependent zinc protease [Gammaproteobacteria bacterium]
MYQKHPKIKIGTLELCDLPELGIEKMHVRVDTGAATSSLHVDNIKKFSRGKKKFVSFDLHPDIHNVETIVHATAPIEITTTVKSSSADIEKRVVISTLFRLAGMEWPIKVNLTDRSEMTYMMLLGREAMDGRVLVDPEFEYLLSMEDIDEEDDLPEHYEEE